MTDVTLPESLTQIRPPDWEVYVTFCWSTWSGVQYNLRVFTGWRKTYLMSWHHFALIRGLCVSGVFSGADSSRLAEFRMAAGLLREQFRFAHITDLQIAEEHRVDSEWVNKWAELLQTVLDFFVSLICVIFNSCSILFCCFIVVFYSYLSSESATSVMCYRNRHSLFVGLKTVCCPSVYYICVLYMRVCYLYLSRSVLLFRPPRLASAFEDRVVVFKDYLTISSLRRFIRDHMWDSFTSLITATSDGHHRNCCLILPVCLSICLCVVMAFVLTWQWKTEIV